MRPLVRGDVRSVCITLSVYIVSYVLLDRISMVQVLPGLGFTLWNPPPACSLALLLTKGLRFAPALFLAAVLADTLNGGFSAGVAPMLVMDAIIAAGYSAIAAALRPFAGTPGGLQSVRDVAGFLCLTCAGVLSVAALVGGALVLLDVLPPDRWLLTVRHFWIGDVTGIVGLLPVLLTVRSAWGRWKEIPLRTRLGDSAVFVLTLVLALWIVFGIAALKEFQFFYLLLLPTIWIGVRHGLPWCAVAILIEQLGLIAVFVFVLHRYSMSDFIDFQLLLLAIAITGLVLGGVVTERQRAEFHFRQQQAEFGRTGRLTTAAALGSTIAHEISQPLATIATYVHACRTFLLSSSPTSSGGPPAFLSETLAKTEQETLRAGEIVDRLRNFISKGDARLMPVDLAEVTQAVVRVLSDEARARGVETVVRAPHCIEIVADRLQMEQVLLNLIRNAIEAAGDSPRRDRRVRVRISWTGQEAQVEVEDNGPGVTPEIAERLFEPFTTSKPRGMGLGLLLSREIIKFHGGEIWCDGAVASGARFTFRLPAGVPNDDGG